MVELNHNNREVKRPDDVPWRTKMDEPEFYAKVDAGIRYAVKVLHAAGIDTTQSCEGGAGHS